MYSQRRRSRIERTKRLLQATTVLGRTLRSAFEPPAQPYPAEQATEPYIEGTFRVVDPEGGAEPEVAVTINTVPEPVTTADTAAPEPSGTNSHNNPATEIPIPMGVPARLRQWIDKIAVPRDTPSDEAMGPDDERFFSQWYTNHAGSRAYKLYVPGGYRGQPLPLVVMLHGCTQSLDEFAASTYMNEFAEKHTFLVAYPAQTFKANLGKCWNWFKEADQQRDQGEPAIIAGLTRQIVERYQLDRQRVYVAGISAGGAMAMVMAATHPDLYAAAGIQSGVPYGVAHNLATGLAAIKGIGSASTERLAGAVGSKSKRRVVPTIVFHGDQDSLVHPGNGQQIIAQWLEIEAQQSRSGPAPRVEVQHGQVPGGHAYTRSVYQDQSGASLMEQWLVHGAGHAWSGGNPAIAWTDAKGPSASQEMLRFFFEHPHP